MTEPNFIGHDGRECGEHRTVGPHRAWCHDCSELCYPDSPCGNCEVPQLREQVRRRDAAIQAVREVCDRADAANRSVLHNGARMPTSVYATHIHAAIAAALEKP